MKDLKLLDIVYKLNSVNNIEEWEIVAIQTTTELVRNPMTFIDETRTITKYSLRHTKTAVDLHDVTKVFFSREEAANYWLKINNFRERIGDKE